jgi:Protein of unknown function (DUF1579)
VGEQQQRRHHGPERNHLERRGISSRFVGSTGQAKYSSAAALCIHRRRKRPAEAAVHSWAPFIAADHCASALNAAPTEVLEEQTEEKSMPEPHSRLGALVGRWRSEGHIVGDPAVPITGTDTYEWLAGGFFLVHHVDVLVGDQPVQAIEIIGEHDPGTDSFTARAYDNEGRVTVMRASVGEDGVWRFTGGADVAAAAQPTAAAPRGAVRSTLTVSADGTGMTARWERSDDGATWQPWMDMTFTRMPEP